MVLRRLSLSTAPPTPLRRTLPPTCSKPSAQNTSAKSHPKIFSPTSTECWRNQPSLRDLRKSWEHANCAYPSQRMRHCLRRSARQVRGCCGSTPTASVSSPLNRRPVVFRPVQPNASRPSPAMPRSSFTTTPIRRFISAEASSHPSPPKCTSLKSPASRSYSPISSTA